MAKLSISIPQSDREWVEEQAGSNPDEPNSNSGVVRNAIKLYREIENPDELVE